MTASSSVALLRSTVDGFDGFTLFGGGPVLPGGDGLFVQGSAVHLYDSQVEGGLGSGAIDFGTASDVPAGSGGAGIALGDDVLLVTSECVVTGGQGGTGAACFPFCPGSCENGGVGGTGLHVGGANAVVHALETTLLPGPGGEGGGCTPGLPGLAIGGPAAAQFTAVPSGARSLSAAPAVVPEGQSVSATFDGKLGDLALLGFSFDQDHAHVPAWLGTILPAQPAGLVALGAVPGGGQVAASFPIPPGITTPGHGRVLYTQGVAVAGPQVVLASASAFLMVDATYDPKDGCP